MKFLAPLAFVALSATGTNAFFRMPLNNVLIHERADPIVSPLKVGGHVHTVSGASGFSPSATFEDLRASKCTSAGVTIDKSAYWTPQLYWQHADGTFENVKQVGGGLIYYLQRSDPSDKTKVTAPPAGFQMLAGNPFLRSLTDSPYTDAIGWNCLGSPSPTVSKGFPTQNCPNGLRAEIRFPSCWDGKTLYAKDGSHMAYSDRGEHGVCPSTHPVRIVTFFFEMMYDVDSLWKVNTPAKNPKQPLVLAQGDPTGFGLHGDVFPGWEVAVLQKALDVCTANSGTIEDCPVFNGLIDTDTKCYKTPDVNEVVLGKKLAKLPGCNPVTTTQADALAGGSTCPDAVTPDFIPNPVAYTGEVPPAGAPVLEGSTAIVANYAGWSYKGCYGDNDNGHIYTTTLKPAKQTVQSCLDAAKTAGFTAVGIEYGGECYAGKALLGSVISESKCNMECNDDATQFCGGGKAMTSYTWSNAPVVTTTTKAAVVTTTTAPILIATSTPAVTTTKAVMTTTKAAATTTKAGVTTTAASAPSGKATAFAGDSSYKYKGCYSDSTMARVYPERVGGAGDSVKACLLLAKKAGFKFVGLEHGGECWAGNSLGGKVIDEGKCNMPCNADKGFLCGGPDALTTYALKAASKTKRSHWAKRLETLH